VRRERLWGAAAGIVLDRAVGEPPTAIHPVAWFGHAMQYVERRLYRDDRGRGVAHAATGVAIGAGAGVAVHSTALATTIAVAGRMLERAALEIGAALDAGDVDLARAKLPALVGRDPDVLDDKAMCRAVVESVAENTVDAVVAPALWAAVAGAPGVLAHRAINTMDAMVGDRNERYAHYGWTSARLDDAAAFVPARATAALVAAVRPLRTAEIVRTVRRDAAAHPSPNSGVAEAAFAAALGVQLGGETIYPGGRVEARPLLGDGGPPSPPDIQRATRLARELALLLAGTLFALGAGARR
jgi:adenosylcobinamide-phosphate synthase